MQQTMVFWQSGGKMLSFLKAKVEKVVNRGDKMAGVLSDSGN